MNKALHTKDIIKATKIGREALRFYEKTGLIKKPKKDHSGYREYSNGDIAKLQFIKMAQEVGFTLREIKMFLNLSKNKKHRRELVKKNINDKLTMISAKVDALVKMKKTLEELRIQAETIENETIYCPVLGKIDLYRENEVL